MAYMDLDGSVVREEAMEGATERGVSDDNLDAFLAEWEERLTTLLGTLPSDSLFFRGILRDLAASQGLRKIARSEEDRAKAQSLYDDAISRLGAYQGESSGISVPGVTVSVRSYRSDSELYWLERLAAME